MKLRIRLVVSFLCLCIYSISFAWNAVGHKIIAQIAFDNLSEQTQESFDNMNQALDVVYAPESLINASAWLDEVRVRTVSWFDYYHYVNWFFSTDGTSLPPRQKDIAIWSVAESSRTLKSSKTTNFEKGIALRILMHVVGDLHQPLHVANKVTSNLPYGDKGGTMVKLGKNSVAHNLHGYWDKGGGFLSGGRNIDPAQIRAIAMDLEKKFPCNIYTVNTDPEQWAKESYTIGVQDVYSIQPGEIPSNDYKNNSQRISAQRLAIAGCRLASVLNKIDSNSSHKKQS